MDLGCQAVATLDVYNLNYRAADGDVVGDVVPGAGTVYGSTRSTRFTLVGHSGGYTVFRARAYFCGVMSNGATNEPGAYTWNYDGSQTLSGSRSM